MANPKLIEFAPMQRQALIDHQADSFAVGFVELLHTFCFQGENPNTIANVTLKVNGVLKVVKFTASLSGNIDAQGNNPRWFKKATPWDKKLIGNMNASEMYVIQAARSAKNVNARYSVSDLRSDATLVLNIRGVEVTGRIGYADIRHIGRILELGDKITEADMVRLTAEYFADLDAEEAAKAAA